MNYRPEIDGLRALAVVPVILFHAGFPAFSGGFIGVDIFFVISGYLITTILLGEFNKGTFTLKGFYERRARRILPVLFFILGVTFIAGFFILLPQDMKGFSGSLLATATFWSNIYFWQKSGYFGGAAEMKPLLHTWSLGVEEQYYIFFPVFLMFAWKFGYRKILVMLAALFVISLAGGHLGGLNKSMGAFFLLPTRCWELLIGIFAAFYLARPDVKNFSQNINNALGLLGLTMICAPVFLFDKETIVPGLPLLLPTLGAALIILFAKTGTIPARLLSFKPVVWIGLISYSAYLWHQPLLALARHYEDHSLTNTLALTLCAATFVLAALSWRYVEQPFRRKDYLTRKHIFKYSLIGILIFSALGLGGKVTRGYEALWLSRQSETTQKTYHVLKRDKDYGNFGTDASSRYYDDGKCRFNVEGLSEKDEERLLDCFKKHGKGYAVIGDSHAVDLFGAVISASKHDFIFGMTKGGCQMMDSNVGKQCTYKQFLSFAEQNPNVFSKVIFEQSGQYLVTLSGGLMDPPNIKQRQEADDMTALITTYLGDLARFVPVIWFGPRIHVPMDHKEILAQGCEADFAPPDHLQKIFDSMDPYLEDKADSLKNVSYLSQNEAFKFSFPEDFLNCEVKYWSDHDHLNTYGEERFGARVNWDRLLN